MMMILRVVKEKVSRFIVPQIDFVVYVVYIQIMVLFQMKPISATHTDTLKSSQNAPDASS